MGHDHSELAAPLIAAAEALGPLVDAHRAELARGPDLPDPIARALQDAKLTRLWLPRDMGGSELPPVDYIRVIEAVARHDGAVGWCASIASSASRNAGLLDPLAAREVYASGFVAGSINPTGGATPAPGGWRVDGRWSWGSFIRHARYVLVMCVEQDGNGNKRGPNGAPLLRMAFLPASEVTVLDTWNAGGLRATGSHDFTIENVFVPEARTVALPGFNAPPRRGGGLYLLPFVTTFTLGITPVALGVARASIDALVALASRKTPAGTQSTLREQPGVQADVARAEVLLRSARAFLFDAVGDYWAATQHGDAPSIQQRAIVRMACWNAAQAGKQVVDLMYSAAGGTATDETAPFAAQLRDVHAAGQHIAFANRNMETAGRILLGMDAANPRF